MKEYFPFLIIHLKTQKVQFVFLIRCRKIEKIKKNELQKIKESVRNGNQMNVFQRKIPKPQNDTDDENCRNGEPTLIEVWRL